MKAHIAVCEKCKEEYTAKPDRLVYTIKVDGWEMYVCPE